MHFGLDIKAGLYAQIPQDANKQSVGYVYLKHSLSDPLCHSLLISRYFIVSAVNPGNIKAMAAH